MKEVKLTLIQKTGLVFCGIFFALLILEAGLRVAGGAMLFLDNLRNKPHGENVLQRKDTFIVLCLGPCFTTGVGVMPEESYPSRLEDILTRHYPSRHFLVINRGVRGKNLSFFVNNLEPLIKKYHPDVVVLNINYGITVDDENLLESISDAFMFATVADISLPMTSPMNNWVPSTVMPIALAAPTAPATAVLAAAILGVFPAASLVLSHAVLMFMFATVALIESTFL